MALSLAIITDRDFESVQFFFEAMKSIVADFVTGAHGENGLPGRARAPR
jgi:hypothetical protein